MKNIKSLVFTVVAMSLSMLVGCAGTQVEPETPHEFAERITNATSIDPQVSDTCTDRGGACLASGAWDLTKRAGAAIKDAVSDKRNQDAVKSAFSSVNDAAHEAYGKVSK